MTCWRVGLATAFLVSPLGCSAAPERDRVAMASASASPLPSASVDKPGWRERILALFNAARGDEYPLDEVPRRIEDKGLLPCAPRDLEVYKGTHLRLVPITIHPAFIPRVERLERAAREVGEQVYGRAPTRLRHFGGYACRRSTVRAARVSEHALGNAIDVAGFDFPALPRAAKGAPPALPALPAALRGPFQVTVGRHWVSKGNATLDLHQEFLRRLTERVERESMFRVLLGPSHPGHQDHFHFDMSPWTYSHL
jgi:hypothetical protein